MKPQRYIPSPVNNEYKLLLDNRNGGNYNDLYREEFDENFDLYHSLKPDFNYYDFNQFHDLKNRARNPFSLLHTNICSLQFNGENIHTLLTNLEHKFDVIAF